MKVALGAAKGLAYLHSAEAKVIYRDFKTSNILLDTVSGIKSSLLYSPLQHLYALLKGVHCINVQDYSAKLSDFGLAKDGPVGEKSHVSTRVMGTHGYAAPEYLSTGNLSSAGLGSCVQMSVDLAAGSRNCILYDKTKLGSVLHQILPINLSKSYDWNHASLHGNSNFDTLSTLLR